jgi:hypothetical protein
MPPMIGFVPILQMPVPRHVHWLIALRNRPIRGFPLRLELSNYFLTGDDDGMVSSTCTWIRGQGLCSI